MERLQKVHCCCLNEPDSTKDEFYDGSSKFYLVSNFKINFSNRNNARDRHDYGPKISHQNHC